jgi:hypothetical protein
MFFFVLRLERLVGDLGLMVGERATAKATATATATAAVFGEF